MESRFWESGGISQFLEAQDMDEQGKLPQWVYEDIHLDLNGAVEQSNPSVVNQNTLELDLKCVFGHITSITYLDVDNKFMLCKVPTYQDVIQKWREEVIELTGSHIVHQYSKKSVDSDRIYIYFTCAARDCKMTWIGHYYVKLGILKVIFKKPHSSSCKTEPFTTTPMHIRREVRMACMHYHDPVMAYKQYTSLHQGRATSVDDLHDLSKFPTQRVFEHEWQRICQESRKTVSNDKEPVPEQTSEANDRPNDSEPPPLDQILRARINKPEDDEVSVASVSKLDSMM
ncbi:hypothetical protein Ciccas_002759 [Cichlidogyrus casuarinus]|uniref:Uncharacterized protein n=1 Tax=Cichlidogyrus casuarinus TaxID=1844966 RepID=A0ABD2QGB1_9PLAT